MGCVESKQNIQIPWVLSSLSRSEWLKWKSHFLIYLNNKYIPPYKQTDIFFKYIGFLGEEIVNNLYLQKAKDETKLSILLFKFDVYFIYKGYKWNNNQTIEEYIISLKNVAKAIGDNNDIDNMIKEKFLQDFKYENIFEKLEAIPSFSNINNYENLALYELIFLWVESRKSKSCNDCEKIHSNKCCAFGKICWKCKKYNHFARCCRQNYITDCDKCGSNHVQNKCPAFTKECSKCNKKNHFSWKCFADIIQSCIYCGGSHLASRQYCNAKNYRCSNCKRMGHYTSHCFSYRFKTA